MADIQMRDAQILLRFISSAALNKQLFTYREAAGLLGRVPPENHSRTVAQICDLLDAAACLAGVPLLALVTVRDNSGDINSEAFKKEFGDKRVPIIQQALLHEFSLGDFAAIARALDRLGDRGNVRAWEFVFQQFSEEGVYSRLTGGSNTPVLDAIDDLGTDTPERSGSTTFSYARDARVRAAVIARADGKCELCGQAGFLKLDGTRYLESHHVIALKDDGADRVTNVIALCPNDHREAHFGSRTTELELAMIAKLRTLPLVCQ